MEIKGKARCKRSITTLSKCSAGSSRSSDSKEGRASFRNDGLEYSESAALEADGNRDFKRLCGIEVAIYHDYAR